MEFNTFSYDLRTESGRDLRTEMRCWNREPSQNGRYDVGSIFTLTRGTIERNNQMSLGECRITRLVRNALTPWKYTAYIREVDSWESWGDSSKTGVDWEGSDGWLRLGEKY